MKNKLSFAAAVVEVIGIAAILLNLMSMLLGGMVFGSTVLILGIASFLKGEKRSYCYLVILMGIVTIIAPILLMMRFF